MNSARSDQKSPGRQFYVALVLALGLGAFPTVGHADLRLCNTTPSRIGVALGYHDKKGWASEGWWTVRSQTCETLLKGKLPNRVYFVHAIDYDRGGEWSGSAQMCTGEGAFIVRGLKDCEARGYKVSGFSKVDTGNAPDWTIQLSDPAVLKSRN